MSGMGRRKTRNIVICPFPFTRIMPSLLTRFVLPWVFFPFPRKRKGILLLQTSPYFFIQLSSTSLFNPRKYKVRGGGGIIYQRKILTGRLSISVAARKLGENRIIHMRHIKMTSEVSCGKRVEILNVLNVIS